MYYGVKKDADAMIGENTNGERMFLSRHYLDMYGSRTHLMNDNEAKKKKKPVVIFVTGGAWIIGEQTM